MGENPRKLGEEILKSLPSLGLIKKSDVAGPGFLNFWLTDEALRQELGDHLQNKNSLSPTRGFINTPLGDGAYAKRHTCF